MIQKIQELKKNGRPVIGCFPLYPPLALFHSLDLNPVVLWGLKKDFRETPESDQHLQNYTCSVARHLTEFLLSDAGSLVDGLFMYNACDTLRNLPEIIDSCLDAAGRKVPLFQIHVPMVPTAQTDGTDFFDNEINQLIKDVKSTFDRKFNPDKFMESIALFQNLRKTSLQLESAVAMGRLSFQTVAETLHTAWAIPGYHRIEEVEGVLDQQQDKGNADNPGILLSGILPPPASVSTAIEASGLRIAGNDIASLHRTYAVMPEADADPASYYRDFYFNHHPCPTLLFTGDRRVDALIERCRETRSRGVIFVGEKFCEYEYFEFPYLEKKLQEKGIQTLLIEIAIDDEQTASHISRIDAFAEMLKA